MLKRRLAANLGANAFAQVVNVVAQLVSVPVFLAFWPKERYGEWLLLYSIPSYLTLAEGGFSSVAANEVSMLVVDGKVAEARRALHTAFGYLLAMSGGLLAMSGLLAFSCPWKSWLQLSADATEVSWSILLLAAYVVIGLATSISGAVYRAAYQPARNLSLSTVGRLAELIAMLVALLVSKSFVTVAAALLLARTALAAVLFWDGGRLQTDLRLGLSAFSWPEFRRSVRPSLLFMVFPLGNALYFQGLTMLVGVKLGPAAVVVFNTSRTLTRVVAQVVAMLKHSAWPEYSYLLGAGDLGRARRLNELMFEATLLVCAAAGVFLWAAGDTILALWTRGNVSVPPEVMALLFGAAAVNCLWNVNAGLLMGVNRHSGLAVVYLGATAASLLIAVALIGRQGLAGVSLAMVASECAMLPFTIWRSCRLLQQDVWEFGKNCLGLRRTREYVLSLRTS